MMNLEELRNKDGFICDMDGVIYKGNSLLPGVPEFVDFCTVKTRNFCSLPIQVNARPEN